MKSLFVTSLLLLIASPSFAQNLADNLVFDSAHVQQKAESQLKESVETNLAISIMQIADLGLKLGVNIPEIKLVEFKLTEPCKFVSARPAYETMNFGKQGTEVQYSCVYRAKLNTGKVIVTGETASFLKN